MSTPFFRALALLLVLPAYAEFRRFNPEYIQKSRTFVVHSLKNSKKIPPSPAGLALSPLPIALIALAIISTGCYYYSYTDALWYKIFLPSCIIKNLRWYHTITACIPLYGACCCVYGIFKLIVLLIPKKVMLNAQIQKIFKNSTMK